MIPEVAHALLKATKLLSGELTSEALSGGLLNHVWRVRDSAGRSLVLKHAPPYIATAPHISLDTARLTFEAKALELLGGELASLTSDALRPPRLLVHVVTEALTAMEDLGEVEDLEARLPRLSLADGAALGELFGRFISQLHSHTAARPDLASAFNNLAIQRTRLEVQYRAVGPQCEAHSLLGAREAGEAATTLGLRLLEPGCCLVMGDLWPRSVVWGSQDGVRLIDWEFAHYGHPAQDIAHFAAHLWMMAHAHELASARAMLEGFLAAYEVPAEHDEASVAQACAVHFGAEVVVRALGPFRGGYLYDHCAESRVTEAAEAAVSVMLAGAEATNLTTFWEAAAGALVV